MDQVEHKYKVGDRVKSTNVNGTTFISTITSYGDPELVGEITYRSRCECHGWVCCIDESDILEVIDGSDRNREDGSCDFR